MRQCYSLGGGWARSTRSSPNESDSVSDSSDIWWCWLCASPGCASDFSFTMNQVSSNFTLQEISKCWWAVSQNWYPLDPGLYLMKIISWLFGLSLSSLF